MHKYFANTLFIGKHVIYLPSCHSTNDMAARLVPENKLFDGSVIITDHQTAGRGQRGNTWEAAPGKNLTFSIFLKPEFLEVENQFYLNIVASLGVCDFLNGYMGDEVSVKWPNDIYYRTNKMGGILIENSLRKGTIDTSIVGIGLNVNQTNFSIATATSMAMVCNQDFDLEALTQELLKSLEHYYLRLKKGLYEQLREEYLRKLYWIGESRVFKSNGQFFPGEITGVDNIGRLLIETEAGKKAFNIKEVEFIK